MGRMGKGEYRREAGGWDGKGRIMEGSWWEEWERENNGGKLVVRNGKITTEGSWWEEGEGKTTEGSW